MKKNKININKIEMMKNGNHYINKKNKDVIHNLVTHL